MLSNHRYKDQPDEELIALYKKTDDLEIVGVLYDRYTALTFGVCLKYLKDREESRDAVMQIFEKLMVSLKEHEIMHFKSWLYLIGACAIRLTLIFFYNRIKKTATPLNGKCTRRRTRDVVHGHARSRTTRRTMQRTQRAATFDQISFCELHR